MSCIHLFYISYLYQYYTYIVLFRHCPGLGDRKETCLLSDILYVSVSSQEPGVLFFSLVQVGHICFIINGFVSNYAVPLVFPIYVFHIFFSGPFIIFYYFSYY